MTSPMVKARKRIADGTHGLLRHAAAQGQLRDTASTVRQVFEQGKLSHAEIVVAFFLNHRGHALLVEARREVEQVPKSDDRGSFFLGVSSLHLFRQVNDPSSKRQVSREQYRQATNGIVPRRIRERSIRRSFSGIAPALVR